MWATVLISLCSSALVGFVCFWWGRRSEKSKASDLYIRRLREVQEMKDRAVEEVENQIRALEERRMEFDRLPWNKKIELLGLKDFE